MKNSSTAILTTIFPAVERYLPVFLTSLTKQTNQQFDLIIVNDGIADLSIISHYLPKERYTILQSGNTFVENRLISMSYAQQQNYQRIIFADADDALSENRAQVVLSLLENNTIVVNDVDLIGENENLLIESYFSQSIKSEKEYSSSFIENKNFVGLGNTAIQTKILPTCIQLSSALKMPDWYFFYTLMRRNQQQVFFTNKTKTLYRQHAENLIGLKKITDKRIELGLEVKLNHYKSLIDEFPELTSLFKEITETNDYYASSKTNKENYINKVKALNLNFPLWWEEIKTLNELNIQP